LASTLKKCSDFTTERAEAIVALTLEDYLYAHRPWELDGAEAQAADEAAEYAHIEEVMRAMDALRWRALVVAGYVGRAMVDYVELQGADLVVHPWLEWRKSCEDEPAARWHLTFTQF
jgi:hypothetical protein